jgi:hypothetical protein
MEELEDIWYEDLFDIGLDEYLTQLFTELESRIDSSNAKNFEIVE